MGAYFLKITIKHNRHEHSILYELNSHNSRANTIFGF
jgi:hypothetical protein